MGNDAGVRGGARDSFESAGICAMHELSQQRVADTAAGDGQQIFGTAVSARRDYLRTVSWFGCGTWGVERQFFKRESGRRHIVDRESSEVAGGSAGCELHGVPLRGSGGS